MNESQGCLQNSPGYTGSVNTHKAVCKTAPATPGRLNKKKLIFDIKNCIGITTVLKHQAPIGHVYIRLPPKVPPAPLAAVQVNHYQDDQNYSTTNKVLVQLDITSVQDRSGNSQNFRIYEVVTHKVKQSEFLLP